MNALQSSPGSCCRKTTSYQQALKAAKDLSRAYSLGDTIELARLYGVSAGSDLGGLRLVWLISVFSLTR